MSRRAHHERELRQHNLMLARIDQFESGRLAIGPTVNDLEALLYELELASETWRDAYIEEWSVLELAYAWRSIASSRCLARRIPLSRTRFTACGG